MQTSARRFLHPQSAPGGGLILRAQRHSHSHLCHPILAAGPLSLRAFYRRLLQLHRIDQRWCGTTGTPECRKGEYMIEGALRGNGHMLKVAAWNALRKAEVTSKENIYNLNIYAVLLLPKRIEKIMFCKLIDRRFHGLQENQEIYFHVPNSS